MGTPYDRIVRSRRMVASVVCTAVAFLLAPATDAQPAGPWEISIGAPWRGFGKLEMRARDMTPGGPGVERFLDGEIQVVGLGLFAYTVTNPLTQIDAARLDRITYADLHGDACNDSLGSTLGTDIGLRREVFQRGPWRLGLSASLRWLALDHAFAGSGVPTSLQYSIYPNAWPSPNAPGGGPDPDVTTAYFLVHDPLQLATANGLPIVVEHKIDLDVYELAVGGFAAWEHGTLQLGVGVAPVLAFARIETESMAVSQGALLAPQALHDVEDDLLLGIRVSIDFRWQFHSSFFVAVAAEHEWFTDKLTGDTMQLDLDGTAWRAAIGCQF